jgi:hypothetical protein
VLEEGGPLAVNGASAASSKLADPHPPALDALGHGYAIGFVVCGSAAIFSALLALVTLRGSSATGDEVTALA